MESNRISIARALELGVQLSWREAAAIVYEAILHTGPTRAARPVHVHPASCLITRGGEVVLEGDAARARPETMTRLLEHLLPACDSPGGLGAAFEGGTALAFLEELAQRTTAKRRRIEIAKVAIRGLGAEADLARAAGDAFTPPDAQDGDAEAFRVPSLPAEITPRIMPVVSPRVPASIPPPPDVHQPTPFAAAASMPPRLASATAPALDDLTLPHPPPRLHDFEHWRAELKLRTTRVPSRPGLQALLDRLRRLDRRQVAAASVTTVLAVVWWLWPSAPLQLPPSPRTYPPSLTAVALMPGWADVDRLGRSAATRASTLAPPAAGAGNASPSTASSAVSSGSAPRVIPATPAAPPASRPATVATTSSPPPATPTSSPDPTAIPRSSSPAPASPPNATASPAAAATPTVSEAGEVDTDTVYSWTSAGVEPPVFRYPAMPAWAVPDPGSTIDGPYFEVLVDPQGLVETVRVRGRIEPGETYYRHNMMLPSAKLWQFRPARLNGRPVRYVVRVVIDEPQP